MVQEIQFKTTNLVQCEFYLVVLRVTDYCMCVGKKQLQKKSSISSTR